MMNREENQVNKEYGPNVLEHFIGQKRNVIEPIQVALDAAFNDGTRLPHMLFCSPPGLGKTELAHICMKEMASPIHETLGQNLSSPKELNAFLLMPQNREVALIDELDEASPLVLTTLYRSLENGQIFLGGEASKKFRTLQLEDFTIIACTNNFHALPKPLVDRFRLILHFDFYAHEEIETLLRQRARHYPYPFQNEVFVCTAKLSRGTPRVGIRLLEAILRVARSENSSQITVDHFRRAMELEGIDLTLGLRKEEQKYLRIVAKHSKEEDRPVRLGVISSIMGIPARTVQVLEEYLLRLGLCVRTDGGRQLTQAGWQYLERHPS